MLAAPTSNVPAKAATEAPTVDAVALVLVCAWCGQPIGRAAMSNRRIVSHGMCRPCLEELVSSESRTLLTAR